MTVSCMERGLLLRAGNVKIGNPQTGLKETEFQEPSGVPKQRSLGTRAQKSPVILSLSKDL
jgi:hypothetical protein